MTGAKIEVGLQIGSSARRALLMRGGATSGTASTLRFFYTVVTADTDTDGAAVVQVSNKLVLLSSGASLKDAADADAGVTHAGLSAQSGHLVAGGTADPGHSAPTFSGTASDTLVAPGGTQVFTEAPQGSFSDDDPLTFALSVDRGSEVYSSLRSYWDKPNGSINDAL